MDARGMARAGVVVMLMALLGSQLGCSSSMPAGEGASSPDSDTSPAAAFQVTLDPSSVSFVEGEAIELTISIVNFGNDVQAYGQGSSRCRLSAMVLVDGERLPAGPMVPCTMDMVQYRLAPGEVDKQTWRWDGTVIRVGLVEKLPPGIYDVYGRGGEHYSDRVVVTLRPGQG
jgi:archaellum component FlaG (FlaF/FlaG flagellin family)